MYQWECPMCGADVEEEFEACWQCGLSSDLGEDPDFNPEVDVAELPPDWTPRIECDGCGYYGKALIRHDGYPAWLTPLSVLLAATVVGVIPWMVFFLLLGNRTHQVCPDCGSRRRLANRDGLEEPPSRSAEQLWREKQQAADRSFARSKRSLLTITAMVFAVSFTVFCVRRFVS